MNRQELKTVLLQMKKTNYELPKDVEVHQLAEDLVNHIGDLDAELRDELVLSCLWTLIVYDDISIEQQKDILERLLSEEHLFLGLGELEGDAVFNRTFSVLIVKALAGKLEDLDYSRVLARVLEYGHKEIDLRGYVEVKGWAHSTAHMSDALTQLAGHKKATADDLKKILELIKVKMSGNELAYVYGEDERMARATEEVFRTDKLSKDEIINYIKSYEKLDGEYIDSCCGNFNGKNYLRGLYFRLRKSEYDSEVIEVIDQVIAEQFSVTY